MVEDKAWKAAEKTAKTWNFAKGKIAVLALMGAAAPWAANAKFEASAPAHSADKVTNNVALDKPVSILEGGTATVDLGDGKRVTISNPIVAKNGTVLDRTQGKNAESQLVTPYDTGETDSTFDNADSITFTEEGKTITEDQALEDATPELLQVVDGSLVVESGLHAGEQVAVGQAEHVVTETVTKTVAGS